MARDPRLRIAALVVGVLLTACAGGADGGGAGGTSARLGVLEEGVEVAAGAEDPAAADFRTGEEGEGLALRDVVRTDASGLAEVTWVAGALTRVDADSLYVLTAFDDTPGQATMVAELEIGRVWNRLRGDVAETFELRTDVGSATVRGTAFWIRCDGGCTYAALEGAVDVATTAGVAVELVAGQQVTVDEQGAPGEVTRTDPDDPWVVRNLRLDEAAGFDPLATEELTLAGDLQCPLVAAPSGWVAEADPDAEPPADEYCRFVDPDPDPGLFVAVEWFAAESPETRERLEVFRAEHERQRAETAAGLCRPGMVSVFLERDEPLGVGQVYGWESIVLPGPGPDGEELADCIAWPMMAFHAVIVDGQVFLLALEPGSNDAACPLDSPATPEQWRGYLDCVVDVSDARWTAYLELATTMLGG